MLKPVWPSWRIPCSLKTIPAQNDSYLTSVSGGEWQVKDHLTQHCPERWPAEKGYGWQTPLRQSPGRCQLSGTSRLSDSMHQQEVDWAKKCLCPGIDWGLFFRLEVVFSARVHTKPGKYENTDSPFILSLVFALSWLFFYTTNEIALSQEINQKTVLCFSVDNESCCLLSFTHRHRVLWW